MACFLSAVQTLACPLQVSRSATPLVVELDLEWELF